MARNVGTSTPRDAPARAWTFVTAAHPGDRTATTRSAGNPSSFAPGHAGPRDSRASRGRRCHGHMDWSDMTAGAAGAGGSVVGGAAAVLMGAVALNGPPRGRGGGGG